MVRPLWSQLVKLFSEKKVFVKQINNREICLKSYKEDMVVCFLYFINT
jgi:hypothetical protein